jgi:hypothetical protein
MPDMDLGYLVEGVVEQDPLSDRYVLKVEKGDGTVSQFDIQEALARYKGQEVRLTLASFESINALAEMVEKGELSLDQAKVGGSRSLGRCSVHRPWTSKLAFKNSPTSFNLPGQPTTTRNPELK